MSAGGAVAGRFLVGKGRRTHSVKAAGAHPLMI
jgi:hypothetical protein